MEHHAPLKTRDEIAGPAGGDQHGAGGLKVGHGALVGRGHAVVAIEGGEDAHRLRIPSGRRAPVDLLRFELLLAQGLGHEIESDRRDA